MMTLSNAEAARRAALPARGERLTLAAVSDFLGSLGTLDGVDAARAALARNVAGRLDSANLSPANCVALSRELRAVLSDLNPITAKESALLQWVFSGETDLPMPT